MSSDSRAALVQRRDEMLLLSERCFTSALGIEDGEAWLHHYILGKISEKLQKPPGIYLEHYQKVNEHVSISVGCFTKNANKLFSLEEVYYAL